MNFSQVSNRPLGLVLENDAGGQLFIFDFFELNSINDVSE